MNRNKLNFEEISQSMEVLDQDSQRCVKGGLSAAELLADIAANGIGKHAGFTYAFDGAGANGIRYMSNTSIDSGSSCFTSGFAAYGGQGGYGNPYQLAEVVVTAGPSGNSGEGSSSSFWSSFSSSSGSGYGSTFDNFNQGGFGSESYYGGGSIINNVNYAETAKDFQAWIDSALNYLDNVYTAASMTADWALGIGPD
jgi:hypothetical protein